MRKVWAAAAAGVAVVALAACGAGGVEEPVKGEAPASSSAGGAAGAEDAPAASADVRIVSSAVEDHETWGPKAYVVRYEVTNGGSEAADYFAQFEFLDGDGDVLGSTGVTADKLGAGKTHKGDTAPLPAEITNGDLADIKRVRVSLVERT
ncbi:hypothetical protein ACIPQH_25050 [Streptomyces rubiginosohelvolus]|uniref:hypothetical protein n=1 Tax=Streptomyces rubiginosohelvolus TaxID=67362 RepID=UPI00382E2877